MRGHSNGRNLEAEGGRPVKQGAASIRYGLRADARIGLFGGSFNPAHTGHLAVSDAAVRACRLDRIVWLVSPGNPLKDRAQYLPLAERVDRAKALTAGRPDVLVSDVEAALGTRYAIDTIEAVRAEAPAARLVWVMGADSLAGFHDWRGWRRLVATVPLLVLSRPGEGMRALTSVTARSLWGARVPAAAACTLAACRPPAWCYLPVTADPSSATAMRAAS